MRRRRTLFVDSDILVVGGGMSGCGATYESRYWGRDLKIVCVEKANIERERRQRIDLECLRFVREMLGIHRLHAGGLVFSR
jgi:hypothetical protein